MRTLRGIGVFFGKASGCQWTDLFLESARRGVGFDDFAGE